MNTHSTAPAGNQPQQSCVEGKRWRPVRSRTQLSSAATERLRRSCRFVLSRWMRGHWRSPGTSTIWYPARKGEARDEFGAKIGRTGAW